MNLQRTDIVGHRITGIWESRTGVGAYTDHFASLTNGLLVKFSSGDLLVTKSPYPTLVPAEPWLALGAPGGGDDSTVPACIGQEVVEVIYSAVTTAPNRVRRDRTYLLLGDGRYLTSGLGFNYTELESDSFERWYAENKFTEMFRFHWGGQPFNPFGAAAIEGGWSGGTVVDPGSK
jgi:hypothetical protein